MLPSPTELTYFLEIAEALNLSRAAERIGVSQPALTLAVRRLEDAFGHKVLIRGKTGVRLTKAGEKLAYQSRILMGEWEKIKGDSTREEHEVSGRYTLGCHPSVAMYTLPYFMPQLFKEFPKLNINLAHASSRKINEDIISFRIDFGIVVNPVPHPELIIKNLYEDAVTLWVAPKALKNVLICEPDLPQTTNILQQLAKGKTSFERVIHSSSLEVITGLVSKGIGVGILPTRVATRLKEYNLKLFDPSIFFADKICLVYRPDVQKSGASKMLAKRIFELLLFDHRK